MKMINIGFGNFVTADRIIAAVTPESAPVKRLTAQAKETGKLIDVTHGRRTRSVIITDSEYIILSGIQPLTICERITKEKVTE